MTPAHPLNPAPAPTGARNFLLDGIWGFPPRWEKFRARIDREVGPCRLWHYDASGRTSLEVPARQLAEEVARTEGPVNLIGFSMGGLVIREALRQAPNLRVQRIVLIHSPNKGSLQGHLLPMLPACREMRPGSAFLRRLDAEPWTLPTLVTWCPWDLMVVPGGSACWEKATRRIRSDVPAHAWPVVSPGIHSAVVRFLREPLQE